MLQMLFNHIKMGQDFHIRAHWEEGTVVGLLLSPFLLQFSAKKTNLGRV